MNKKPRRYLSIDGAVFTATTSHELMSELRSHSWNPEKDLNAYCKATAKAAKLQTGKTFRASPPEALAEDLECAGLLTPITESVVAEKIEATLAEWERRLRFASNTLKASDAILDCMSDLKKIKKLLTPSTDASHGDVPAQTTNQA